MTISKQPATTKINKCTKCDSKGLRRDYDRGEFEVWYCICDFGISQLVKNNNLPEHPMDF